MTRTVADVDQPTDTPRAVFDRRGYVLARGLSSPEETRSLHGHAHALGARG